MKANRHFVQGPRASSNGKKRSNLGLEGSVLVLSVAALLLSFTPTRAVTVCPSGPTLRGIDVSSFNGVVDWNDVASNGIAFAFVRVSDGTNADGTFDANYAGVQSAGMVRGTYQLFRPRIDPVAQANLCLSKMGPFNVGDLPPVLDVEVTDNQSAATIVNGIQSWVTTVQAAIGRSPIIFCSRSFWNTSVASSAFSTNPLWVAHWSVSCPNLPNAWSAWKFWQYSSSGSIDGISGSVFLDEFNGAQPELLAMTGPPVNHLPILNQPLVNTTNTYGSAFSYSFPVNTFTDPDAGQTLTYTASNLPPGISFDGPSRTFSGTTAEVGTYSVTVTATDNGVPPLSTNAAFFFEVARAELTVAADNQSRPYGQANPPLTGSLMGVTHGDNITVTFATTATPSSPPGDYPIGPIFSDPDNRLPEYSVTTNNGTLTVTCATNFVVTTTADSGPGSLRQAILDANAVTCAPNVLIGFNIPGPGVHTIAPLTALPTIIRSMVVDGYTQPGASLNTLSNVDNAVLLIELTGSSLTVRAYGLGLDANDCTVRGLVINGFTNGVAGILIENGHDNLLEGNFIGTDPTGANALFSDTGIAVSAGANNRIGGLAVGSRNVIVAESYCVDFEGSVSNTVIGNFVGTAADGATSLPGTFGLYLGNSSGNQIGGSTLAARNVISAATVGCGIYGGGTNVVQGNFIGTDASGTLRRGAVYGVLFAGAADNLVGGTITGQGNLISGNDQGVVVTEAGADRNLILGNLIGTDITGTNALGNTTYGVLLEGAANIVGGTNVGARNVISGNPGVGVFVSGAGSSNNIIAGNFIGVDAGGARLLGNGLGIALTDCSDNQIVANVVAGNAGNGISLYGTGTTNNLLRENSIFANGGLGIDLGSDGMTPNDPADSDDGANHLQNSPEVTSATVTGGQLSVRYRVDSSALNCAYPLSIELFLADLNGQGKTFLYRASFTTPQVFTDLTLMPAAPVADGDSIVCTATDASGNTSEFSIASTVHAVIPNSPALAILAVSNAVVISWLPDTPGFVLQQNASLDPLTWTNVPSGSANPVTLPIVPGQQFFRMFKP